MTLGLGEAARNALPKAAGDHHAKFYELQALLEAAVFPAVLQVQWRLRPPGELSRESSSHGGVCGALGDTGSAARWQGEAAVHCNAAPEVQLLLGPLLEAAARAGESYTNGAAMPGTGGDPGKFPYEYLSQPQEAAGFLLHQQGKELDFRPSESCPRHSPLLQQPRSLPQSPLPQQSLRQSRRDVSEQSADLTATVAPILACPSRLAPDSPPSPQSFLRSVRRDIALERTKAPVHSISGGYSGATAPAVSSTSVPSGAGSAPTPSLGFHATAPATSTAYLYGAPASLRSGGYAGLSAPSTPARSRGFSPARSTTVDGLAGGGVGGGGLTVSTLNFADRLSSSNHSPMPELQQQQAPPRPRVHLASQVNYSAPSSVVASSPAPSLQWAPTGSEPLSPPSSSNPSVELVKALREKYGLPPDVSMLAASTPAPTGATFASFASGSPRLTGFGASDGVGPATRRHIFAAQSERGQERHLDDLRASASSNGSSSALSRPPLAHKPAAATAVEGGSTPRVPSLALPLASAGSSARERDGAAAEPSPSPSLLSGGQWGESPTMSRLRTLRWQSLTAGPGAPVLASSAQARASSPASHGSFDSSARFQLGSTATRSPRPSLPSPSPRRSLPSGSPRL
eukprot:TRINITY_DN23023_c0_g1_i2.p1 TRINITY_DN23023_c0_g1~~TRINITY_DN23023_c0_g1_i2.p1  ORF type:complete len:650 (+),score=94.66 TRINITY_DN23023_c0_g1_i2:66-1952(+)